MSADLNQSVYELSDVVGMYVQHQQLTRGEQLLFSRFQDDYRNKKVLDIGVGGGRTTPMLAGLAQSYLGIDFSNAMVEACKARFSGLENAKFLQDDARTLSHCPDAHFDSAIFSFNGIDTVDIDGRAAVLESVYRVLVPGGTFVFSFHNAGYLETLYRYHWQKNPLRWWPNYQRQQRIKLLNGPKEQYGDKPFFKLKDGGEDFRLDIYYFQPSYQQQMLAAAGFQLRQCVESLSGKELRLEDADSSKASWLYYRCTKE